MRKNTLGKFLCMPFILLATPLLAIGLIIRFGFNDAMDIMDVFTQTIKDQYYDM
jgi:hypothetical protein